MIWFGDWFGIGNTTIIRTTSDILGTIDQDYVKFGNESKSTTSQNNQGTITRQAGDRSLTAKGEGRTLTATTAGKTGTFKSGKRKVTVK